VLILTLSVSRSFEDKKLSNLTDITRNADQRIRDVTSTRIQKLNACRKGKFLTHDDRQLIVIDYRLKRLHLTFCEKLIIKILTFRPSIYMRTGYSYR
jgi:hypothetical protein